MTDAERNEGARNRRHEFITRNRKVYITQCEAGEILGVTDRTIRTMISDHRLRGYKLGPRVVRLRLDEVEAALRPIGG
ncbi:MAG: excisionase family DNA-binding protein [Mycobacterium sp.]|nr:excisionase family DNA-binding protein [Mycobacterium sp.]